jgi:hypothetical protein
MYYRHPSKVLPSVTLQLLHYTVTTSVCLLQPCAPYRDSKASAS